VSRARSAPTGRREYPLGTAFPGKVARTFADSIPAWPRRPTPPAGAPNVVIVLLDDVGFGEIGCFGGLIETPTFDRLAAGGLRYRNFHTTAICVPSRAALLTGRNQHASGMGSGTGAGFPGYHGFMPKENGLLSESLRAVGYATFAIGKWHLAPPGEDATASPKGGWPLGRGFDRFYGFIGGTTDQFVPELVYDNHAIDPPRSVDDGYHLSEDLADRAIEFIGDLRAVESEQPFFLYYCPAAGHSPHQVPTGWAERYRGRFDEGWEVCRQHIFERQLEMGIVPLGTQLPPRPSEIPDWATLDGAQRRLYARQMEVYAGFLSHADAHIGRVVSFLSDLGELDDTIVILASDNGASSEGGPFGGSTAQQTGLADDAIERMNVTRLADWGRPASQMNYSWAWAWAGNTPMRKWKRFVHEGGVADPLVVHWPGGIRSRGVVRDAYVHITDLHPTIVEAVGIAPAREIESVAQAPIHGVTFRHTFDDGAAPTKKAVQYYECVGSRAIWRDGWKAVIARDRGESVTEETLRGEQWELYHVAEDFAESRDLAAQHPEKLRELVDLWWIEAGRYDVLPINAANLVQSTHTAVGTATRDAREGEPRTRFVYHRGAPVPHGKAPDVHGRAHRITAEIRWSAEDEGVLLTQGDGHFGGYALFIKERRAHYVHNFIGLEEFRISATRDLPVGDVVVDFRYEPRTDGSGVGVLSYDGDEVGRCELPRVCPPLAAVRRDTRRGLSCGYVSGRPVACDLVAPFRFTGEIKRVTVRLGDG
jgi:arylsulfatase A-like enzyme